MKRIVLSIILITVLCTSSVMTAKAAEPKPAIVMTGYEISEGAVIQGNQFTLTINLKNMGTADAYNIYLNYSAGSNMVYPIYGEPNQKYIDKIEAGDTAKVEIEFMTAEKAEQLIVLSFSLQYGSDKNITYLSDMSLYLPLDSDGALKISSLSIPENMVKESRTLVSISLSNTGSQSLSNVVMHLDGKIQESQKEISVGTLSAGENKVVYGYITFSETGDQVLTMDFTYTNADGTVKEVNVGDTTIKVTEFNVTDNEIVLVDSPKDNQQIELWKLFAGLGAAMVVVLILAGISYKFRKRR